MIISAVVSNVPIGASLGVLPKIPVGFLQAIILGVSVYFFYELFIKFVHDVHPFYVIRSNIKKHTSRVVKFVKLQKKCLFAVEQVYVGQD